MMAVHTVGLPIEAPVMAERIVWVGLSAALLKSYVHCYYFVEVNRFLYNFAVGRQVADLLLLLMIVSLPPVIGPTLGTNFRLSRGLDYPHWLGSASRVLADRD